MIFGNFSPDPDVTDPGDPTFYGSVGHTAYDSISLANNGVDYVIAASSTDISFIPSTAVNAKIISYYQAEVLQWHYMIQDAN